MKTTCVFGIWGVAALGFLLIPSDSASPASGVIDSRANLAAAGGSFEPAFSADGRFLLFVSHAHNLVTNDDLGSHLNVFVRDLNQSNTLLVSANLTGIGGGNADATSPSISSNGQWVVFASAASNFVGNDTNDAPDIFVRDLSSATTRLVSVDLSGTSSARALSSSTRYRLCGHPLISADGRWVIFESLATNLVALTDGNQMSDIFARDLQSNRTALVSVNAAGTASGNGNSDSPSITPDGRAVAFASTATDLVPGVNNLLGDIYVRDLTGGTTVWASREVGSLIIGPYRCFSPALSANGHFVTFKAAGTSDPNRIVLLRYDLDAAHTTLLTSNSVPGYLPQISADGRFITSEIANDLYLWDLQTGSNVLVNINATGVGPGNQPAHSPAMALDGSKVAFVSTATDLALSASNGVSQLFVRDLALGTTRLLSAGLDGRPGVHDLDLATPAISGDGTLVAFEAVGADLVGDGLNRENQILLTDLTAGTLQLASARHPALVARTAAAMTATSSKALSADGHFLTFLTSDPNLAGNTSQVQNIFFRDLANGTNSPVGIGSYDRVSMYYGIGIEPVICASGRYIAFGSAALVCLQPSIFEGIVRFDLQTGLAQTNSANFFMGANYFTPSISSDGNLIAFQSGVSISDILVSDASTATNRLVSVNLLGNAGGNSGSYAPLFSPDDRRIVFASAAINLATNNTGGMTNLFARDLISNTTRMISVGPDGGSPLGYNRGAAFSADSGHVAFVNSNGVLAVYGFASQTSIVVCAGCDRPSLSADGRLVAYETAASETSSRNIMVKDLQTGLATLVSVNRSGNAGGNGDSSAPLLSWDGRYVVFASKAGDLVENDTNSASDIFVRDRLLGTTLLISARLDGSGPGNGSSSKPTLAADGRTIFFQSFASDLIPGDYNERRDMFMLRLGRPDNDGDGMDDDWEMAYFGTLARDGTGDFDSDGRTDLEEFLAGTDPTDAGSIFRVFALSAAGANSPRLIWSAAPGKTYRVQAKDSLDATGWNDLPGTVVANGTTASFVDNSAGAVNHRFYRVTLVR